MEGREESEGGCSGAHHMPAQALVETDQPAENLLAVRMELLQLVLNQLRILR